MSNLHKNKNAEFYIVMTAEAALMTMIVIDQ